MHHTGKNERKKEKEKKKGYEKSASKGFEPKPSELAKSVNQHFSPLDHVRNLWWLTVFKNDFFGSV